MLERLRLKKWRSLIVLLLVVPLWSITIGWGVGFALDRNQIAQVIPSTSTANPASSNYKLGRELYLENCSSCHLALPPEVLPTESWRQILQQPNQHYGQALQPLIGPSLLVMWDYIRTYSRPIIEKEPVPYRVSESRYFKALHPRVELPKPTRLGTCLSCHPGADQYNYRRLTPEWENSP